MANEEKPKRIYTRPDANSFEEYKAWFRDFCKALGAKDEPDEEMMRKTWKKLEKLRESKQAEDEKNAKKED